MEGRSTVRNRRASRLRETDESRNGVIALRRGLRVFEAVAEAGGAVSLADLADRVDLPKTTVHRLLQTLVGLAYVESVGDGNYRASSRVLVVAGQVIDSVGYSRLIGSALRKLRTSTPDTIHVGMLRGSEAVYVEKLEGERPYQMISQVGQSIPLHSTSIGKAILAFLSTDERSAILDRIKLSLEHRGRSRPVPGWRKS
jgi:DNA-binding IclR family transcriptional regulator